MTKIGFRDLRTAESVELSGFALVIAGYTGRDADSVQAHIDELAASYEKPEDVVRWYFGDRQRLAEVEAVVIENNVTDHVLKQAKVTEKALGFDELMGNN